MKDPKEDDIITNADESKRLPDENPEPLEGVKKDETEIKSVDIMDNEYEGKEEAGNVAAKNEEDTRKLDGSNANNLRTK